jgi:cysteine desulfurase family protein (TIGR01976 family)
MYDVEAVRAEFPALQSGIAYFDGPGGSQIPRSVAEAISNAMTSGVSNRGGVTESELRADDIVLGARQAMADLLGGEPGAVVFGRSMTQLTYDFSRALAKRWTPDDEIVVTRLDHDANIRPWVQAAATVGATVRWVDFDRGTGELATDAIAAVLSERTRLVAVTGASNLLGTRPDIPAIADAAHQANALCYVDGVHLVPHVKVDLAALGADLFACSPYKFFGPHLGVLAAAPDLLDRLWPDKLLPSTDDIPERFELGTLPYELLAGISATVDFIAGLAADTPARTERPERLTRSYEALDAHENAMLQRLEDGLDRIGGVVRYGKAASRTPLVLFSAAGVSSAYVYRRLAAANVNAPAGSFYALECSRWLGLGDDGAVRAGLAPYTNADDVDRLLEVLDGLVVRGPGGATLSG